MASITPREPAGARREHGRPLRLLLLGGGLLLLAWALRMAPLAQVHLGGRWFLFSDDPPYHVRRALITLASGAVPDLDPFVNFPRAGRVLWPPGLAWFLASVARLLGATGPADKPLVEAIACVLPPLAGAILAPLTWLTARRVLGEPRAWLAGLLVALAPQHVQVSVVSRYDHNLLEPLWLLLLAAAVALAAVARRWQGAALGGLAGLGLLWTVPSAPLLLGALAAAILLAASRLGRPGAALLRGGAWALGGTALLAPLALVHAPFAAEWVFFSPSLLHLALLTAAALALGLALWLRTRAERLPPWVLDLGAAAALTTSLLALPPLRAALAAAVAYARGSSFAVYGGEATPLLADPQRALALTSWPLLAAPALALWQLARRQAAQPLPVLAAMMTLLLFLAAASERRWGVAAVPFAAIVAAAGLADLAAAVRRWRPLAAVAVTFAIGAALPSARLLARLTVNSREALAGRLFLEAMATLTPPASPAPYDPAVAPSYGVLAQWWLGQELQYAGERPALATNFFGTPWHDDANRLALRLLFALDCDAAAAAMEKARLRYVLLAPEGDPAAMYRNAATVLGLPVATWVTATGNLQPAAARTLVTRLGPLDGGGLQVVGRPDLALACGRFRLVLDAAALGQPGAGGIKLYEVVAGARLAGTATPGTQIRVTARLHSSQRPAPFDWTTSATADGAGAYALRLPYAVDGSCPLRIGADQTCPVYATGYAARFGAAAAVPLAVTAQDVALGLTLTRRPQAESEVRAGSSGP